MENKTAKKAVEMIEEKLGCSIFDGYIFVRKYYTSAIFRKAKLVDDCIEVSPMWCQVNVASGGVFVTASELDKKQVDTRVEWMKNTGSRYHVQ